MISEVKQFLDSLETKAKELEINEFLNRPSLKAIKEEEAGNERV